jgi:hypothetical protein
VSNVKGTLHRWTGEERAQEAELRAERARTRALRADADR